MPKIVTVNWDALDRAHPVIMKVTDDRTASLEYRRAELSVAGDDPADRTARARDQIAQWARDGAVEALPVHLYDVTKPDPVPLLLVCTHEGDFVKDIKADDGQRAQVESEFREWQKARRKVIVTSNPQGPAHRAVKEQFMEPPPQERPELFAPEVEAVREAPAALPPEVEEEPLSDFHRFDGMEKLLNRGKDTTHARRGWRGYLNKRLGLTLAPDKSEERLRADLSVITRGWTGHKVIAVANDKGGAGKTPVSILLGAAMARNIALLVTVFDNNESAGLAKDRVDVEGEHARTAKHLAAFAKEYPHARQSQMMAYLHRHKEDRYHLLASHHPTLIDPPMTKAEVAEVYKALSRFYSMTITDSGNTLVADNWLTMVQHTDQLVVPLVTAADRYERARSMLATLDGFGGRYSDLARNSVVVVSQWRREDRKVAEEYADLFRGKVREVVVIPYDEHLNSHDLRFDALAPETQAAFIALAAAVTRGVQEDDAA